MIPIAATIFWGPMAYAIMGGLAVPTLLTLVFLPALYVAWFGIQPPDAYADADVNVYAATEAGLGQPAMSWLMRLGKRARVATGSISLVRRIQALRHGGAERANSGVMEPNAD